MDYDRNQHYEIEKSFHDELAKKRAQNILDSLQNLSVNSDTLGSESWSFILNIMGELENKCILDVGCGFGLNSILFAKQGAIVTGIDISDESIKLANKCASAQGVNNIDFKVLKAEDLNCEDEFDIIFCKSVLHHLPNVENVISSLHSCLKEGGLIVALEPKAENLIARIARKYFTQSTPNEHPFKTGELYNIFNDTFGNADVKYFELITPLCLAFEEIRFLRSDFLKNLTYKLTKPMDKFLLSYDSMAKHAWVEVIYSKKNI